MTARSETTAVAPDQTEMLYVHKETFYLKHILPRWDHAFLQNFSLCLNSILEICEQES